MRADGLKPRVFVTGMGVVSPVGNDVETYWRNLVGGVSGIGPITAFDASRMKVRIAGEVKGFDPLDYMSAREARRMDRFAQFAVAVCRSALCDAQLAITDQNAGSIGIVMNTGSGGVDKVAEEERHRLEAGADRVTPFFVPLMSPNMASAQPSIQLGIRGPVLTSVAACAAGTMAMVEALVLIRSGLADVVVAGGTESIMHPLAFAGFTNMHALSTRNDDPAAACRPFDLERNGFVFSEGAAALVLESEAHALGRGARVVCELAGGGMSADAYHITKPSENGRGAAEAMSRALSDADMLPSDIEFIAAHGTGTQLNDVAETKAIKTVFGDAAYGIPISATKSMVGHLCGAAGAISALTCALAIQRGVIPPTINLDTPDPECDLDYVPKVARHRAVHAALANGFGFGGQNAVAAFRAVA